MAEVNNKGSDAAAKAAAEAAAKKAAEEAARKAAEAAAQKAAQQAATKVKASMPKVQPDAAKAMRGIKGGSEFERAKLEKPPEPKPTEPKPVVEAKPPEVKADPKSPEVRAEEEQREKKLEEPAAAPPAGVPPAAPTAAAQPPAAAQPAVPLAKEALQRAADVLKVGADRLAAAPPEVQEKLAGAANDLAAGRNPDALAKLGDAAKTYAQSPEGQKLIQDAAKAVASKLPPGVARTMLSDPKLVGELSKSENAQALAQVATDPLKAASTLASNPALRNAAIDAAAKDPAVQAQLDKVGLTAKDLKDAATAAPHLLDAARAFSEGKVGDGMAKLQAAAKEAPQLADKLIDKLPQTAVDALGKAGITPADLKASKGDLAALGRVAQAAVDKKPEEALRGLADLAANKSPLLEKAVKAVGDALPEGGIKRMVQDPAFQQAVAKDPAALNSAAKLFDDKTRMEGARELLSNPGLRNAAINAIAQEPKVAAAMKAVGIEAADLQKAGAAAPHLLDAADAIAKGEPAKALEALKAAGPAATPVIEKMGQKIYDSLPQGTKDAIQKLGFTRDTLGQMGDAAPHLLSAAQNLGKGETTAALKDVGEALKAAPDIAKGAVKSLADNLPPGALKTMLGDKAVQNELTKPGTLDSIGKLVQGDLSGAREMLNNPALRDAALKAVGQDPKVAAALDKVGLKPDDLVKAGPAAPHLLDAAQAAAKGDMQGTFDALKKAGAQGQEVLGKIASNLASKLPEGPAKALLTNPSFHAAMKDPKTLDAAGKLLSGDGAKMMEGAKELLSNPKLQDAVIDTVAGTDAGKKALDAVGLTAADLKGAKEAAPHLLDAAQKAAAGDAGGVIKALGAAAQKAPALVNKAMDALQAKTDNPALKSLLGDKGFREALGDPKTAEAAANLVSGDGQKALEGARQLLDNPKVRDAALKALGQDPKVAAALDKVGLKPDDLVKAGPAAPHLLDAAQAAAKGDAKATFEALKKAGTAGQEVLGKVASHLASKLPDGPAKALLTNPSFHEAMKDPKTLDAAQKLLSGDGQQMMQGAKELASNPKLQDAVIDTVAGTEAGKKALDAVGLTAADLKGAKEALPHLLDAGQKAAAGDAAGALKSLSAAAQQAPALVNKGLDALQAKTTNPALKSLLGDKGFREALVDPKTAESAGKLLSGDPKEMMQGAKELMSNPKLQNAAIDAVAQTDAGKKALAAVGLSAQDLKDSKAAAPHLLDAAQKAAAGDVGGALKSMGAAAKEAPGIYNKAMDALAAKTDNPALKSLLTDKGFREALTDPKVADSAAKLASGDAKTALEGAKELAGDPRVRDAALKAAEQLPAVKTALAKLGLKPGDLAASKDAAPHLLDAASKLTQSPPDLKGAFNSTLEGISKLPPDVAKNMAHAIGTALKVPPKVTDFVLAAGSALQNPEVRNQLGQSLEALGKGDAKGFVAGLAGAVNAVAKQGPESQKALLNAMGKLPGAVGRFFGNDKLNEALVKTGAAGDAFDALGKLGSGDTKGALTSLMTGFGKLAAAGEPISVAGQQLPIGKDGAKNIGMLMEQFGKALPPSAQAKIAAAAEKAIARSGLSLIPGWGLIAAGSQVPELVGQLAKDPKDWTQIGLTTASIAVDAASAIPGVAPFATPARMVIGTAKVLNELQIDPRSFLRE